MSVGEVVDLLVGAFIVGVSAFVVCTLVTLPVLLLSERMLLTALRVQRWMLARLARQGLYKPPV